MMNKRVPIFSAFVILLFSCNALFAGDEKVDLGDVRKLTTDKSLVDELPGEKLSNRAVEVLTEKMFPVKTDVIKDVRNKQIELEKSYISTSQPKILNDIIMVSTKPGASLSKIYVSPGFPSTVNIFDSTGQPWPIKAIDSIEGMKIEIQKVDSVYLNTIKIITKAYAGITSMNISLVDYPAAIPVLIEVSTEKFHSSPIVQIDREGPQAKQVISSSVGGMQGDKTLKDIVLGIAPPQFEVMKSSDPNNVEAWRHEGSLYVRTQYFPAAHPRGVYTGPNGYTAYKLSDTPLLTMQDNNGNTRKIQITAGDK